MFKNGIGFCQLLSLIQESTIHAGNTGFALRKNRTLHLLDHTYVIIDHKAYFPEQQEYAKRKRKNNVQS